MATARRFKNKKMASRRGAGRGVTGGKKRNTEEQKKKAEEKTGEVEKKEEQRIRDSSSYFDDISTLEEAMATVTPKPKGPRRMVSAPVKLPLRVTRSFTKQI